MRGSSAVVAFLICAVSSSARAHESPKALGLVWVEAADQGPDVIVSNRGLVFADRASGKLELSLRCNEAYDVSTSQHPTVVQRSDGSLLVGVYHGVYVTPDRACTLTRGTGLPMRSLGEVVTTADRLLVQTRTVTDQAEVLASQDEGATWSPLYQNAMSEFFEHLLPAPSDPSRVYAAGGRFSMTAPATLCSKSDNNGQDWQELVVDSRTVPFAVHPTQPDVVFAYQSIDELGMHFRVLRSGDGCATFETVLEGVPQPTDLAMVPGSSTLWLSFEQTFDMEGGLFRSDDDGHHFEHVLPDVQSVSCIEEHAGRLWVCANHAPNENGVWSLDEGGGSVTKFMAFADVTKPVACEDPAARTVCAGPWYDFDIELHPPIDAPEDAGTGGSADAGHVDDAGAGHVDGDAGPVDAADASIELPDDAGAMGASLKSKDRCTLSVGNSSSGGELALLVLLSLVLRRRRRL